MSCLTGNPLTPDLPFKPPVLGTLQVNFANSITAQQQGGREATGKKNTARAALLSALRQNAAYVQSLGLTTVEDIFSTGYDVTSSNKTQSPLTTPVFSLDNSFPGQITVNLSAVVSNALGLNCAGGRKLSAKPGVVWSIAAAVRVMFWR